MADTGAQYFTEDSKESDVGAAWLRELAAAGVVRELQGHLEGQRAEQASKKNWVAHGGMRLFCHGMRFQMEFETLSFTVSFSFGTGASTVPKYFLQQSHAKLQTNARLVSLERIASTESSASASESSSSSSNQQWRAIAEDGSSTVFDAVILTLPAPQVLQLKGDVPALLTEYAFHNHNSILHSVRNDSKLAEPACQFVRTQC